MIRDDYILRIIEQFAEALAAYLRGETVAMDEVIRGAQSRTALPLKLVATLGFPALVGLLGGASVDAGQALTLGLLLVADGGHSQRAADLIDLALAAEPELGTEAVLEIRAAL